MTYLRTLYRHGPTPEQVDRFMRRLNDITGFVVLIAFVAFMYWITP